MKWFDQLLFDTLKAFALAMVILMLMYSVANAMTIALENKSNETFIGFVYRFDHPDFPGRVVNIATAELKAGKSFKLGSERPDGRYGFRFISKDNAMGWSVKWEFEDVKSATVSVYNDKLVLKVTF